MEPRSAAALHPQARALLDRFDRDGVPPPYDRLSVLEARAMVAGAQRLQGERTTVASVRDILVDGGDGRLPARIYHPAPGVLRPLAVYFHGGGFVTGSVAVADRACRALAAASGWVIASVEYRLAPESPFPAPVHDCVAAVRWLGGHAHDLGADGSFVLAGDSAGAALVAACTMVLRDEGGPRIDRQILIYPTLAPPGERSTRSLDDHGEGFMLTRGSLDWFWTHYLREPGDADDPLATPLFATDVSRLPPLTMVVSEFDPLRDDGLAYAQRLQDAGAEVTTWIVPGALHGFWWMDAELDQAGELTAYLADCLRRQAPPR